LQNIPDMYLKRKTPAEKILKILNQNFDANDLPSNPKEQIFKEWYYFFLK